MKKMKILFDSRIFTFLVYCIIRYWKKLQCVLPLYAVTYLWKQILSIRHPFSLRCQQKSRSIIATTPIFVKTTVCRCRREHDLT